MRLFHGRKTSLVLAAGALIVGISLLASSSAQAAQNQPPMPYAAQPPATSTLQVTGTADRFTLLADHADVRGLLSAVFNQAGKDFTLDNNVAGQVTMRLTGQSFSTVLDAVCKQTFLRYHQDPVTGITTFSRDDAAVAAAFSQLRTLNTQLAQQLRALGLDVPNIAQNGAFGYLAAPYSVPGGLQNPYRFVEGNANAPAGVAGARMMQPRPGLQGPAGPQGPAAPQGAPGQPGGSVAAKRTQEKSLLRQSGEDQAAANLSARPNGLAESIRGGAGGGGGFGGRASVPAQGDNLHSSVDVTQQLRSANNYVELYVPRDQTIPVRDALEQLAEQAHTPLLIDPHVPAGPKFRFNGSIPARTLPDALNLLAPTARLEWRWVGDTIYVTTAPDFQIFYGSSNSPRATYPPAPPTHSK